MLAISTEACIDREVARRPAQGFSTHLLSPIFYLLCDELWRVDIRRIEPIDVHHLGPRSHKVLRQLLPRIAAAVDLGIRVLRA
jgi:hypothetical protein